MNAYDVFKFHAAWRISEIDLGLIDLRGSLFRHMQWTPGMHRTHASVAASFPDWEDQEILGAMRTGNPTRVLCEQVLVGRPCSLCGLVGNMFCWVCCYT